MLNKFKMLKEMHKYKYRMWRTETAQPIRDESYPCLPSKPIRDEIDYINKTTAAMYSKRGAVKEVKSQHYVSAKKEKRSCLTTALQNLKW